MATTPATHAHPALQRPRLPAASPARTPRRSRGQSLAEFALTLPMALLMVLFGLDFGRVFLGWVALNNAAREAANYAAMNPTAWTIPYNTAVQTEYARLVTTEAASINCTLVTPVPAPSFDNGTSVGAPATVELTCGFHLITPLIGILTGNPIAVSASSAFPIRAGNIEGIPVQSTAPTDSPAPTVGPTGTPGPTGGVAPTATPAPTAAPTSAPSECNVISLLNVLTNKAQAKWKAAGFTGTVIFSPLVPPNYQIAWQSLTVGNEVACTTNITVRSSAP